MSWPDYGQLSHWLSLFGQNIAVGMVVVVVYATLRFSVEGPQRAVNAILVGGLFGLSAVASILVPVQIGDGVILDARNVFVLVGSLFGGPVSAAIATLLPSIYRGYLGGVGMYAGIGALITSGVIGALINRRYGDRVREFGIDRLAVIGLVNAITTIFWARAVAAILGRGQLSSSAQIAIILIFPAATALLGSAMSLTHYRVWRRTQRHLVEILETVSEFVWETDDQERFTFVSARYREILGVDADEVLGRTPKSLGWRWQDNAAAVTYATALATRKPFDELKYVPPTKDGSRRLLSVSGRPAFDARSRFTGYRGTAADITEREKWHTLMASISGRVGDIVGQDFLKTLAQSVAEALGAQSAAITIYDSDGKMLRTCVRFVKGQFAHNLTTSVEGLPSAEVLKGKPVVIRSGLAQHYPRFIEITGSDAEAYAGTPLIGAKGVVLGLLSAAFQNPLADQHVDTVLQLFAGRAAAEIERMAIEDEWRRSRERLLTAQRIGKIASIESDLIQGVSVWSPELWDILGLDPAANVASFARFMEMVHPDDRALVRRLRERTNAGEDSDPGEFRVIRPNGEVRWLYRQGEIIRDADGKPVKLIAMLQDITDRRILENELRRSREHLLLAQRTAGIGSAEVNLRTDEEYWSDELIKLLGLDPQRMEYTFRQFLLSVHPDDREMLHAQRARNNVGVPSEPVEFRIVRPDGAVRWLRRQIEALYDASGQLSGLISTHQDITDRKRMEEAIRESNDHLRRAQRTGKIGSAEVNLVTGEITWSDEQYRMFGLDPAVGGASYELFLSTVHPDDLGLIKETRERNARGDSTPPLEFRCVRPGGEVRWMLREVEVEVDNTGKPVKFLTTQQDITDRKRMEQSLRHSYEGLVRAQRMGRIGSAEVDLITDKASWSDEQFRIYGLDPSISMPGLEEFLSLVHLDDRAMVRAARERDGQGNPSKPIEFRIIRKDGEVRWIHREVDLLYDETGKSVKLFTTQQDVTDRRRMEEELQLSAQHLASAQRVGKMASVELDMATRRTVWSTEAFRLFGIDPAAGQPRRQQFLDLVHPDDRERLREIWAREREGQETEPLEYRIILGGQETRWLYRQAEFVRDADGKPTRLIITHQDVTEREKLRRLMATLSGNLGNLIGEDFLKALIVNVAQVLDADFAYIGQPNLNEKHVHTQYLYAEGAFVENRSIPLWDASRIVLASGKTFMINGDLHGRFPDAPRALDAAVDIQAYVGTPLLSAKGEPLGILVAMSRRSWESTEYVEAVLNLSAPRVAAEIERLANETEAERSRTRMAEVLAALDIARDAIILADEDRKVIYTNEAAITLLGLPGDPGAIEGKRLRDFQKDESFIPFSENILAMVRENGEWRGTGPWTRPSDNKAIFFDARIHRLPKGGLVAVASDATSRIRLEEEERRRQEWQAQASKLEALGNLAGGIAHDFNNLLGAILGFGQFLVEDLESGSEQRHFAERIVAVSQRGRSLVQQILTFARRGPVEASAINLVETVAETYELLRATLPATTDIIIENHVPDATVLGDKGQLSQVLVNLCVNGSDALAGNPGKISVSVDRVDPLRPELARLLVLQTGHSPSGVETWAEPDGTVWIVTGVKPLDPCVSITISDTGSGIPLSVGAQIFEPFFTTKGRGRGTGLGLAVVHRIVLEHNGAILVRTRHSSGTSFEILLPLVSKVSESPSLRSAEIGDVSHDAQKSSILVVDDDESFCAMVETALKRLGYRVQSTNDPRVAQGWVRHHINAWDVLVTDQNMPHISGEELVRFFKANSPTTRSIICTGYSSGMNEQRARAAGAEGFLLKPFDSDRLASMVGGLLQTGRS